MFVNHLKVFAIKQQVIPNNFSSFFYCKQTGCNTRSV